MTKKKIGTQMLPRKTRDDSDHALITRHQSRWETDITLTNLS